ncbi:MAG: DNA primase family protein [Bacillota bacterium]
MSSKKKNRTDYTPARFIDSGKVVEVSINMPSGNENFLEPDEHGRDHTSPKLIDSGEKVSVLVGMASESQNSLESDEQDRDHTSPRLIDSGEKVSVLANIPYKSGSGEGEKADKAAPERFEFKMFKKVIQRDVFKVWKEQVFVYHDDQGVFVHLNDNELKTLIRSGWDDKIQARLGRNVLPEIIERIRTEPSMQVDDDYFNCYTHLVNCWNGVYKLDTGEFLEKHSPEFRFTHCVQADYMEKPSGGETFKKFLKTSLRNDIQKEMHLQEVVGYMLSEYSNAKKVPMIIGKRHSGKSTLSRVLTTLIGNEYVSHVPMHRLHERFILAHLSTKKANICSEIGDEPISNIEVFKAITGGDELVAEFKGKDHFSYKSKLKLMFCGNTEPMLKNRDITSAFYDRLTFIRFDYTVPEKERDYNMEEKILQNDRSYILSWAIEGLKRLIKNNFVFSESKESIEYKKRYIMEQNNTIDFIKSYCEFERNNKVHLKTLYDRYLRYCHENCFRAYSKEEFFAEISKHRVIKKKFRLDGSAPLWGYEGIKLLEEILDEKE